MVLVKIEILKGMIDLMQYFHHFLKLGNSFISNLIIKKKVMVQLAAFIAAYVTCVSRVSDYHHRGSDVIGGIVIGVIVAAFITRYAGKSVFWAGEIEKSEKSEKSAENNKYLQ